MDRAFAAAYDRLTPAAEPGGLGDHRERLLAGVSGHIVDIGAGVGAALDHLHGDIASVTLLEPSRPMATRLRRRIAERADPYPIDIVEAPGEAIPLADDSVDVAVCVLVLCTVEDVALTLREIRRVLRTGGRLAVLEHVRGDGLTGRVQETIRPVWSFFGGGCDPSRPTRRSLEQAGFDTSDVEPLRLTMLGPASPAITGIAHPR